MIYIWKRKICFYSTYSSFLVINFCNQGKTLCSPCIWKFLPHEWFISRYSVNELFSDRFAKNILFLNIITSMFLYLCYFSPVTRLSLCPHTSSSNITQFVYYSHSPASHNHISLLPLIIVLPDLPRPNTQSDIRILQSVLGTFLSYSL